MSYSLKKHEILRSKKKIQELFQDGSSFFLYPFKVIYLPATNANDQVLFTVPKRYFKNATDRNLIRRRIRESFRLNKANLSYNKQNGLSLSIALIYISKFKLPYSEIDDKLKKVIGRLNKV